MDNPFPLALWFCNKDNSFNWLANQKRPMLSCSFTAQRGGKVEYQADYWLSKDVIPTVNTTKKTTKIDVPAGYTALVFPNDTKHPLFGGKPKA